MEENINSEKTESAASRESEHLEGAQNKFRSVHTVTAIVLPIVCGVGIFYWIITEELFQSLKGPLYLIMIFLFLIVTPWSLYRYSLESKATRGTKKSGSISSHNWRATKFISQVKNEYQKYLNQLEPLHCKGNDSIEMRDFLITTVTAQLQELNDLENRIKTEWDNDISKDQLQEIQNTIEQHIDKSGTTLVQIQRLKLSNR